MDKRAFLLRRAFLAMTCNTETLKNILTKSGGVYLSPWKNVIYGNRLRYLPTEQARGAKGGAG
jgi:hypothetical protein